LYAQRYVFISTAPSFLCEKVRALLKELLGLMCLGCECGVGDGAFLCDVPDIFGGANWHWTFRRALLLAASAMRLFHSESDARAKNAR